MSEAVEARPSASATWLARAVLAGAIVWCAALLVSRADYVPIWDGRIYADCVVSAARNLTPSALRCAQHPSHAYVAILALAERVAPGTYAPILAANAVLLAGAALAFAVVLRRAFPARWLAPERTLLVAALVVHPVILANVVQPGLDFGAMVFFLAAVAAAFSDRLGWLVAFGLMSCFSKESGVLLYAALAGCYAASRLLPRPVPRDLTLAALGAGLAFVVGVGAVRAWPAALLVGAGVAAGTFAVLRPRQLPDGYRVGVLGHAIVSNASRLAWLSVPVVAFAGYLAYRATLPAESVLWMGEGSGGVLRTLLTPYFGPPVWSYLALLLILGFLWLPTLPLLADTALGLRRFARSAPPRPVPGADRDVLVPLAWLTVAAVYLLTRYVTFANARYLLPAYPLMLVMALAALIRLGVPARIRVCGLAVLVVAVAAFVVRTVDPVSRALWGTFDVGARRLLRITSLTGECCGLGRDQLAYNLEFTGFAEVTAAALERIQPVASDRLLATSQDGDWCSVGPLDRASRRTLAAADSSYRSTVVPRQLAGPAPDTLWYLSFPYDTSRLASSDLTPPAGGPYELVRTDTVRAGGFALPVRLLVRRVAGRDSVGG